MNAVQSFFRKYHAIPATNKGPSWSEATDKALLAHAEADINAWSRVEIRDRLPIGKRLLEIHKELRKRIEPWLNKSQELVPSDIAELKLMFTRITQMSIPE